MLQLLSLLLKGELQLFDFFIHHLPLTIHLFRQISKYYTAVFNFIPPIGFLPVRFSDKKVEIVYAIMNCECFFSSCVSKPIFMQDLFTPHSIKTAVKVALVVALLFILVNLA